MKRTPLRKVSNKQRQRKRRWNSLVVHLIMDRADGHCEVCGDLPDFRGLQGHHKIHRSQGGEDTEENCVISCGRCHDFGHGINDA